MGDPNATKLLDTGVTGPALERQLARLCGERLARLDPILNSTGLHDAIVNGAVRSWLDLGTNDGTILYALKRRYPQLELAGIELRRDLYEDAARRLQRLHPFEMHFGCWTGDFDFAPATFDVVSSIHAWPVPRDYDAVVEEARRLKTSATHAFYERFDPDYSLTELAHFFRFLAPGGLLVLKTWEAVLTTAKGPIGQIRESLPRRLKRLLRPVPPYRQLVLDPAQLPGTVVALGGPYMVLRKPV